MPQCFESAWPRGGESRLAGAEARAEDLNMKFREESALRAASEVETKRLPAQGGRVPEPPCGGGRSPGGQEPDRGRSAIRGLRLARKAGPAGEGELERCECRAEGQQKQRRVFAANQRPRNRSAPDLEMVYPTPRPSSGGFRGLEDSFSMRRAVEAPTRLVRPGGPGGGGLGRPPGR